MHGLLKVYQSNSSAILEHAQQQQIYLYPFLFFCQIKKKKKMGGVKCDKFSHIMTSPIEEFARSREYQPKLITQEEETLLKLPWVLHHTNREKGNSSCGKTGGTEKGFRHQRRPETFSAGTPHTCWLIRIVCLIRPVFEAFVLFFFWFFFFPIYSVDFSSRMRYPENIEMVLKKRFSCHDVRFP
jgi:hypothetical protein